MPWQEESLVSQRYGLIEKILLGERPISSISKEYGVSRKTAYKWLNRYKSSGIEALSNQNRAPYHQPNKSDESIEELVISIHKQYPCWGPYKLKQFIINQGLLEKTPSHPTIGKILKRHGYEVIKSNRSSPAKIRFERESPNELWQMDFKGSFMTGRERCYPLTILDDHSRFSIGLTACRNEKYTTVKEALIPIFKEYGLPQQINVDNGNPWGDSGRAGLTALEVWLMKLDVRVSHSAPYHPQTNGKDERFHRTLKLELLSQRHFKNCHEAQGSFKDWQHTYNFIRPHHAIGGKTPASRYRESLRKFPDKIPEPSYQTGDIVKRCDRANALIRYKGKRYRIGGGFKGELIALRETDKTNIMAVFFMDTMIKLLNLNDDID